MNTKNHRPQLIETIAKWYVKIIYWAFVSLLSILLGIVTFKITVESYQVLFALTFSIAAFGLIVFYASCAMSGLKSLFFKSQA